MTTKIREALNQYDAQTGFYGGDGPHTRDARAELSAIETERDAAKTEVARLSSELGKALGAVSVLEEQRDALRAEAAQKLNNLERGLATATRERDELNARVEELGERCGIAERSVERVTTQRDSVEAALHAAIRERDSAWDAAIEAAAQKAYGAAGVACVAGAPETVIEAYRAVGDSIRALKKGGQR